MSPAERMSRMRARQAATGLATVTLVVPAADAPYFHGLAARRRSQLLRRRALAPIRSDVEKRMAREAESSCIKPSEIMETRVLLEVAAVGLVTRNINSWAIRRLRSVVDEEAKLNGDASPSDLQKFHLTLGELSGDPALQLFIRVALLLTHEHSTFNLRSKSRREDVVSRLKVLHGSIAAAIIDRNEPLAVRRMRRYLSGLKDWLR